MAGDCGLYPAWEFLDCDGEVPQSRSGHTCALHRNRFLYIFGGFDGSNCFDDLYVLDLECKTWRKIEASGDWPSGRASHSAVTDELSGVMYIFGGSGSHFGYTNKRDLCEFCFETETWRLLSNPPEDTPSARYGQSMVAYKEGLYVWGGTHGTNYPTDMHRFDLCSKQWENVMTAGDLPCGRYRHQAMVKDDLMYIVGGSGINRYGDVFTFHFGTSVWRKLVCTGTDLSDGRYAHSAVLREGYIYLYGGNDGVRHDDLQQLDLETRVWSRIGVHGQCPPGRDFHAAVLRKDSMVIFGGSNGMRRHNDVFEFHIAPKNPPCSLASDFEALLEQAQQDEVAQCSCDVYLQADQGESMQGIFCHSRLLYVRCPRLYLFVQEHLPPLSLAPKGNVTVVAHSMPASQTMPLPKLEEHGHAKSHPGPPEQAIDALLRDVVPEVRSSGIDAAAEGNAIAPTSEATVGTTLVHSAGGDPSGVGVCEVGANRQPAVSWVQDWPHGHCATVPIDMSYSILTLFIRFLYSEVARFGLLSTDQLYQLFLAANKFEVSRLAALCGRLIKVRLDHDTVLPLLRASTQDGAIATAVQDACKHFFLANYHQCTDLHECEALDPKLLCELMRMHNARVAANCSAAAQQLQQRGTVVGGGPPSILAPLGPQALARAPGSDAVPHISEELGGRAPQILDSGVGQFPIPQETLAMDLKRLLTDEVGTDFEVVVQGEVISAHRFVLVARSRYFASCILTSGMVEAQAGRLVIPETSAMTADAFRAFLRFLYAGDDFLDVIAPHTAMYLVDASSFYSLTNNRLKHFCEACVKDSFNEAHVLQLFEASSRLNVEAVRIMALEFIITHFQTVSRQPALEHLDKPLLIEILKGIADRWPQQPAAAAGSSMPQSMG
eukprot:TRINITY_DN15480_c0_g2_i1.p1 TRINITY_DN15480_c0_g2~~TRINITY_DN15480_c0_g2_i1.p1  ORF type:complete len:890 (+),score=121.22 TRINITY_DN15480_c0_g2_i1:246-2915(+)